MRHILKLTILFLIISASSFAQKGATDTTKKDTALINKIDRLTEVVQKLADKIKIDTVKEAQVGEITFTKTDDIQTYTKNRKDPKVATKIKIKIKKIVIEVRDGVVFDIQAFTEEGKVFSTEANAPIELNRLNERCDLLGSSLYDGQKSFYIQTCDFLCFERMGGYIPTDTRIVLTKDDKKKTFSKSVDINNIFNIKLYSDLLGAFGNEGNGLVQTDVDFKTPVLNSNLWNTSLQWLNYFTFNFNISRFDDKFKNTALDSTFKRIDFHQHSWLNTQIGFNIISGNLGKKSNSRWGIDLIGGVSLSNATSKTDTSTTLLPYFGFNPSLSIKVAKNIFVNLSSKLIWQYAPKLRDSTYGGVIKIITPELEFGWNPFTTPGSKIFARVRYVQQIKDNNPFFQFQLGYNLSLSELANKKLDPK